MGTQNRNGKPLFDVFTLDLDTFYPLSRILPKSLICFVESAKTSDKLDFYTSSKSR